MEITDIVFRTAREDDIEGIMNIEIASFSSGICEKKDVFLDRIRVFRDGFYIMEYQGRIIGYLCSEIWKYKEKVDETDFVLGHSISKIHDPKGNEVYISSMGTLPEFRGMGLGKLMFEEFSIYIIKKYEKLKSKILIVSENWYNARKIYVENGFEEIAIIKDFFYYNNVNTLKEDGIIMRKCIHFPQ